jgi:outer membrane protein assembly factor BamA
LGKQQIFTFEGNHFFSVKELSQDFIDLPNWLLDPNIIGEQILYKYYAHGFWYTKIRYTRGGARGTSSCVSEKHFIIQEGERVIIDQVIVEDCDSKKKEINKFFFQSFLEKKYYDEALLNISLEKLKNFYIEHGFWDFTILSQQIIKLNKNHYTILFNTKKGSQRFLENNLPFNPADLAQERLDLLAQYQKEGYWYVDAQPTFSTIDQSPRSETLHVDWDIETGEKVKFDKLIIHGSTKLPFKRIIKEIEFEHGDLWCRKKLNYSRKKLKNLGVFNYITLHPQKLSHQQSKKPIILTLFDDKPVEIKLRTGYFLTSKNFLLKRESTYKLGTTILVRNWFNCADKLMLHTNISRFEKDFDLDYHVPHFLRRNITGKWKLYAHDYLHPLQVGKSDSAYQATQNGLLFCITKEYKPMSFWGVTIGNEWMKTERTRGNLKLANYMIGKTIPYFFCEPNLVIDNLDDKIKTTNGSFMFCSIKCMVPEKNNSCTTYKLMLDRSMFYRIYNKIILAMRLRWGHIFRQKFEEIMPIERFYLGGQNSVRGYSKDTVPPLGKSGMIPPTAGNQYTIQGGSSMLNGNFELRFPIYKSFGGVIFQDIGLLSQSSFSGFKGRWYPSSGWGLRYQTPIGALRFDIGWKWKKSFAYDTRYAWYLTLGQVF